ncbi:hypothetical protein BJY16_008715 [Actinoplanes octamycinicus]|uniref:CinY protein n=1 Tax=Actinoplanes octamycinicus TaxID=135948 RepID=A0A7W7H773_9ACTN|nr:CinY protein [Actinoplanes octamycinicus]MBB4745256.1 hypothetical protein [Actinoplanes octamycinicus]GIE62266.1 hypothetical protein Aoc01nite_76680 [Actinoplanes octamycinicus]
MARTRALAAAVLASALALTPASAAAFGTIEGGGQHREHERITRAALACRTAVEPGADCFEPKSMDQLAGHARTFGAVGSPDSTEVADPAAHCDDADFLDGGGYPRTREQATAALRNCVDHLRRRFGEAVRSSGGVLDADGRIIDAEVSVDPDCELAPKDEPRAKCEAIEAFGRALHGVQDFHSRSNWADEADPGRSSGPGNPPGLNLPAPSPVLDLRGTGVPAVPRELSTGCFVLKDTIPGTGVCAGRVTHAALNKDNGLVDPGTGDATEPTTPRGLVRTNFAKAVTGAVVETRHQWQDFQGALEESYGAERGARIACALTHDTPATECRARAGGSGRTVLVVFFAGVVVAGLGLGWGLRRR